ncbi:ABC transporter permease [Nonomuraea glycinis]|uniref:ABC transporter permease n=1 Tax=Nonomuraea glycinis TaxID=2047744 RepID=UPI0033A911CB
MRGEAQYRANVIVVLFGSLAYQGVGLAFIGVVVGRFGQIGGWSLSEILFLYGLRLTAHGLWFVFFNQIGQIDTVVLQGEFDRFLVRPINPLLQLMTRRAALAYFGDLIGGVALLSYAASAVDIDWSIGRVLFLMTAVLGGALVEVSIQLTLSAFSFRLLSTRMLRVNVDMMFNTFGSYPMSIFPNIVRMILTFVLPVAFVAFFPAAVLLEHDWEIGFSLWLPVMSPCVGIFLFILAYRFWIGQMRNYQSSGH